MPMIPGDHRKDCCRPEAGNLEPSEKYQGRDDLTFRRCKVCGCRHFEANAEPGVIFAKGSPSG